MTATLALALAPALAAGCARFDDAQSAPFTPVQDLGASGGGAPSPNLPPTIDKPSPPPSSEASPSTGAPSPGGPCEDPDPAVVATCLEPTEAVAGLPESAQAVVAERSTGKLVLVSESDDPVDFATIDRSEGEVVSLTLSPSYDEDKLVYAALVSGGETKIARVAQGDKAKIVAAGLPASPNGRAGIAFDGDTMLLGVGTEVLAFSGYSGIGTAPAPQRRSTTTQPIGGLCSGAGIFPGVYATAGGGAGTGAEILRVDEGAAVRVWSWPDQSDIEGCALTETGPAVALPGAHRVDLLTVDPATGVAPSPPAPLAEDRYGRLSGVGLMAGNALIGTTTNKAGGDPVATDDRAVILPIEGVSADERT